MSVAQETIHQYIPSKVEIMHHNEELQSKIARYVRHIGMEELKRLVDEHLNLLDTNHQTERKWMIAESKISGRGVIATSDIESGEVIFTDHPLFYGPRAGASIPRGCTVCGKLDCEVSFKCSHCSLRVCSSECQLSDLHERDCFVITRFSCKKPIEEVCDGVLNKALTPIRALQLNDDGRAMLAVLQAHQLPQHGSEVRDLEEYFEITDEEKTIMILACYVLDSNAFQIATKYGQDRMSLRGLYPVAAIMNHSCIPNTRNCFRKDNSMLVKATKLIKAGEEVFACYSNLLRGTLARRHHLYRTKHFLCTCARCSDTTEFGTYLGALKCFAKSCTGSLLPLNPLDFGSKWICNKCDVVVLSKQIGAIQSALGSLIGTLDFDDVEQIEEFIRNRMIKYIPRTNQIFFDLICRFIWLVGEAKGYFWQEVSASRLQLKEQLCRSVLQVLQKLGVGDVHLRGLLLYHLHATLTETARREPLLYPELKGQIQSTIEDAYRILAGDISAPEDLELRKKYLGKATNLPADGSEDFFNSFTKQYSQ